MKKIWDQLGDPWDWEIALRVDQGMDEWKARDHVISRWMKAGDLRPLAASARKRGWLRGPILDLLIQMIGDGQLVVNKGRGRPADPAADARDEFAADTYEDFLKHYQVGSDDLFRSVAAVCGVSEQVVRQAVTARRNRTKS
jgi:hypothetical protein